MKYKTILFDADDTLLDFKRSEKAAISKVLTDLSLPCNDEIISNYSRINDSLWKLLEVGGITKEELKTERFRRLCLHYGFSVQPESMAQNYIEALSEQSYVIDGAYSVCKKIYDSGIEMYIITNGIKYIQTKRFAATELHKFFRKVFISEEIGYEKPRIEYFNRISESIENFDKKSVLIVGDSLSSDIKGGINFGVDTCWYNPKHKDMPTDMPITYEIHCLHDIFSVLDI